MTTSDKSKMSRQDRIRKVLAGAQKHFVPPVTFTLAGVAYTTAQLTDLGQKDIAASDAATQAKATWLKAVQVQEDTHAQVDPVFRLFHNYCVAAFGDTTNAADTLADFGYQPRKPRSKDVAVKNTTAQKARATRKARGTMGPVAKKAIKGTVPVAQPDVSVAAPVATPSTSQPAPAAAPATGGSTQHSPS
jgi:hypothetical protein